MTGIMTLAYPPLQFSYDEASDILTINGIRYAGGVFRGFAFAPVGTYVRFDARKDGTVALHGFSRELSEKFDDVAKIPHVRSPKK